MILTCENYVRNKIRNTQKISFAPDANRETQLALLIYILN